MKNWDKILKDFSHKCKGGAPDFTNSTHLQFLRESLIKFGWKENATNEFIGNIREGEDKKVPNINPKTKERWPMVDPETNAKYLGGQQSGGEEDESGGGDEEISFEPKKKKEIPTSPTLEEEQVGKVQGNT